MFIKKDRNKYKRYNRLVCKQHQLENELKYVNDKLSKCKLFVDKKEENLAKVREKYFKSLQAAVAENLKCSSDMFEPDIIERLSLVVEQSALLAAIQQSIYQQAVSEIIKAVREATNKKSLYSVISFHLTALSDGKKLPVSSTDICENGSSQVKNSTVPAVFKTEPTEQPMQYSQNNEEDTADNHEIDPDLADFIINFEGIEDELNQQVPQSYQDYDIESLIGILEGNGAEDNPKTDPYAETEKRLNDIHELRVSKLSNAEVNSAKERKQLMPSKLPPIEMWQNQRYIHMYKVLKKCSAMDASTFFRTQQRFSLIFGDDSDFEQEDKFSDRDKYLACCSRRIMPLVNDLISRYQTQIRDGSIFKQLTRRITNSLITITESPSHSQIQQYVAKFFERGKMFKDLNDVWLHETD